MTPLEQRRADEDAFLAYVEELHWRAFVASFADVYAIVGRHSAAEPPLQHGAATMLMAIEAVASA